MTTLCRYTDKGVLDTLKDHLQSADAETIRRIRNALPRNRSMGRFIHGILAAYREDDQWSIVVGWNSHSYQVGRLIDNYCLLWARDDAENPQHFDSLEEAMDEIDEDALLEHVADLGYYNPEVDPDDYEEWYGDILG